MFSRFLTAAACILDFVHLAELVKAVIARASGRVALAFRKSLSMRAKWRACAPLECVGSEAWGAAEIGLKLWTCLLSVRLK
jgi:hypothetical protein